MKKENYSKPECQEVILALESLICESGGIQGMTEESDGSDWDELI